MLWGAVEQTCGVLTLITMVLLLMMVVVFVLMMTIVLLLMMTMVLLLMMIGVLMMMMVVVPLADDHGALVVDDVNGAGSRSVLLMLESNTHRDKLSK